MSNRALTGLERELSLRYLMDGNVPITLAKLDCKVPSEVAIFPQVFPSNSLEVSLNKIILKDSTDFLKNTTKVKVQFYFNKLGLYFCTRLTHEGGKLCLSVPEKIFVSSNKRVAKTAARAILRFTGESNKDFCLNAKVPSEFDIFSMPEWGNIELENQKEAKEYLTAFVQKQKERGVKPGVYLLSVCRYFFYEETLESLPTLDIIFCDSKRILLAKKNSPLELKEGETYMLQFYIDTNKQNLHERAIFVNCVVKDIYISKDKISQCAICNFVNLKKEDERFLYEKSTGKLFV